MIRPAIRISDSIGEPLALARPVATVHPLLFIMADDVPDGAAVPELEKLSGIDIKKNLRKNRPIIRAAFTS